MYLSVLESVIIQLYVFTCCTLNDSIYMNLFVFISMYWMYWYVLLVMVYVHI